MKAVKGGKVHSLQAICPEHLWSATRSCTRDQVQYKIFTPSAPDTRFIFVEAEATKETPATVKTSHSAKKKKKSTGRPVGKGPGDGGRNATTLVLKRSYHDAQEEEKAVG